MVLFEDRKEPGGETVEIEGPAFTRFLFSNSRAGLFWLPIRLFVGFAGSRPAGTSSPARLARRRRGAAGYWEHAVAVPERGPPAITFEWYRDFLEILLDNDAQTWFAPLIVFGEIAVGLGLIFGLLTGFAAFFGALMNMSFLLAGSASTNPVLFILGDRPDPRPGRSPATTASTAGCCRCSARRGTRTGPVRQAATANPEPRPADHDPRSPTPPTVLVGAGASLLRSRSRP